MLEREATNAAVKNDLAMTSFLLKINLGQAHLLARQAFEQRPDHPSIASTYAYSLHLLGKTSQGLAVLEKFKPEQLESPGVAAYYGTLLAAAGQTDKARMSKLTNTILGCTCSSCTSIFATTTTRTRCTNGLG